MLRELYQTIYPHVCYGCSADLAKTECWLCSICKSNLPITHFHRYTSNPVFQLFAGRVPLIQASSYYLFIKESAVQHLLHALKYKNVSNLGVAIGEWYAEELRNDGAYNSIDTIIPIPLHKSKLQKRGYNKSEMFAKGLSKQLNKPVNNSSVVRAMATSTQTRKNRIERWGNVEFVFRVEEDDTLINKHILLVDDVITTGATLEACANQILKIQGTSISIATIAFAKI